MLHQGFSHFLSACYICTYACKGCAKVRVDSLENQRGFVALRGFDKFVGNKFGRTKCARRAETRDGFGQSHPHQHRTHYICQTESPLAAFNPVRHLTIANNGTMVATQAKVRSSDCCDNVTSNLCRNRTGAVAH